MTYDHLTIDECYSLYKSIYRRCQRDMAGGLAFGMDWSTLNSVFPQRAAALKAITLRGRQLQSNARCN